jgi:hypothetical protein
MFWRVEWARKHHTERIGVNADNQKAKEEPSKWKREEIAPKTFLYQTKLGQILVEDGRIIDNNQPIDHKKIWDL